MRSQIVHPNLIGSLAGSAGLQQVYVTIRRSTESQRTPGRGLQPGYVEDDKRVPMWISTSAYQETVQRFGEQLATRVSLSGLCANGTKIREGDQVLHRGSAYSVLKVSNSVTPEAPVFVALGDVRPIPKQ